MLCGFDVGRCENCRRIISYKYNFLFYIHYLLIFRMFTVVFVFSAIVFLLLRIIFLVLLLWICSTIIVFLLFCLFYVFFVLFIYFFHLLCLRFSSIYLWSIGVHTRTLNWNHLDRVLINTELKSKSIASKMLHIYSKSHFQRAKH